MPNKTKIEWCDYSSNPIFAYDRQTNKRGWHCVHASEGCRNCYAVANPRVWIYFQKFCFELINKGRSYISPDMISHRIRFEMAGEVVTDDPVRINNNHVTYYGDLFTSTYPQHAALFRKRKRVSEDKAAFDIDVHVHDLPREPNAGLDVRMGELAHLNSPGFARR